MKYCTVDGCNRKHHAKGFCTTHYNKYVIVPKLDSSKCSVEGCNNKVSYHFTTKKLCEMHGTRLRRNGSENVKTRKRDTKSIIKDLLESENFMDFEIKNRNSYADISKLFYGNYCHECGWNKGTCESHHIMPVSKGGKNSLRNTIVLCPNCHSLKHKTRVHKFSDKYVDAMLEKLEVLHNTSIIAR